MTKLSRQFLSFAFILTLFILAFWVRSPNMDRPLGDHHEWVTAHSLIIMQNWESQGALKHNFNLLMTFPGENNLGIYSYFGRVMKSTGEAYYVSYPPGALIYPYAVFKLLGLPVTPMNLQLFNMFCHFISAIVFFWIITKILSAGLYPKEGVAALGVLLFTFLPGHLWFLTNTYSWDIFWFYTWIIAIALTLKVIELIDAKKPARRFIFFLGVDLFIMIYSYHYAILYSVAVILLALVKLPQNRSYGAVIGTALIASMSGIALMLAQYSSIDGMNTLLQCFMSSPQHYKFQGMSDVWQIGGHARVAFSLMLIPMGLALLGVLIQQRRNFFQSFSSSERTALYLSFFPTFIFLILMPRWAALHDFSMIRVAPFLILFFSILLNKLRLPPRWPIKAITVLLITAFIFASTFYYKACFAHSEDAALFKRTGEYMRARSQEDEIIFAVSKFDIDPRFMFYLKRNVQVLGEPLYALIWLMAYQKPKGVLFTFDPAEGASGPQRIDLQDLSGILAQEKIKEYHVDPGGADKISRVEFLMEDGKRQVFQFRKGLMFYEEVYNPSGRKLEDYAIDYWSGIDTFRDFDTKNIKNQP